MNNLEWNPDQYLKFEKERTQPSVDLAARIRIESPKRIIDIGCGPGNSTMVLKNRWPDAEIIGLDSSETMLEKATQISDEIKWLHADTSQDLSGLGQLDIVFSNAAVHHMPNKRDVLTRFFAMLNQGGVLAVQVPDTRELPFSMELQKLIGSEKWRHLFNANDYPKKFHGYDYYYEILYGLTGDIEMWQTDYIQILADHSDIVQWYKGSGMRYYLSQLPDESKRLELEADFEEAVKQVYPKEKNGSILMPMRRLFFLAYAGSMQHSAK